MSLLPTFMTADIEAAAAEQTTEIPKEYGIDYSTGKLTGQIVSGKEAIKVWIWNCLHTERFRYPIYSWNYGAELEQYIGDAVTEEFLQTDCEAEITEALKVNKYISDIEDFNVSFSGTKINITFRVITTFGDIEVDEYV